MSDMYYDYAQTVLDDDNYGKLTAFVDNIFSLGQPQTIYFYGLGNNGKSTLTRKMMDNYPGTFGRGAVSGVPRDCKYKVLIYEEVNEIVPNVSLPAGKSGIFVTNLLPDGIHPTKVVCFNKNFKS